MFIFLLYLFNLIIVSIPLNKIIDSNKYIQLLYAIKKYIIIVTFDHFYYKIIFLYAKKTKSFFKKKMF